MIEKKYLTFNELLLRWNCEKHEIHLLIEQSKLVPSIAWNKYGLKCKWMADADFTNNEGLVIEWGDSEEFYKPSINGWLYLRLPEPIGAYKYSFSYGTYEALPELKDFGSGTWFNLSSDKYYNTIASIQSQSIETDAVFMMEKVKCCENIYPDLLIKKIDAINVLSSKEDFNAESLAWAIKNNHLFNQSASNYSEELDFAFKAWQAITNSVEKGKPKARIKAWLDTNAPLLSNEAKNRISIVVNWEKKGGATRTD